MKNKIYKFIAGSSLVAFAVIGRMLLIDIPNIETLTIAALLGGSLLGGFYAIAIPLSSVAISDALIGNDPIMIFTWSAWAIIGLLGLLLKRSTKNFRFSFKMTWLGIGASLIFFIWTNFGVWAMWNMYPHTWSGLIQCYVMALPFLKMNLLGNLIIIPVVSFTYVAISKLIKTKYYEQKRKIFSSQLG